MKKFIAPTLIVVLFIILAACSKNDSEPKGITSHLPPPSDTEQLGFEGGNIGSGGLMCGDGNGWVYYRSESGDWCLYKAKLDGSEKTKLSEDKPSNINVLDGWVYYTNFTDDFSLYRIRVDGSERQKIIDGYCSNLYVAESGLYFDVRNENNSPQIYRAGFDGKNMELLVPDMSVKYYYNGIVYCNTITELCAYNLQTKELQTLCKKYTNNITVNNNGVFYRSVDENAYYHLSFDGNNSKVIQSDSNFYNLVDTRLYYMDFGGNYEYFCIYCLDVVSGQSEVMLALSDEYYTSDGTPTGVTIAGLRDGTMQFDDSLIIGNGAFDIVNEQVAFVYVVGDYVFSNASLRKSVLETGGWKCLIVLDGIDSILWD